jgi:copper(I)-binding protein
MFKTSILAGTTALLLAVPAMAEIQVQDAYARSASPNAKSGAAFMLIQNDGAADRLIAASTDAAKRAELHTHLQDTNGVMRMIHVEEGFEIPEGEMVALQRGGKHVMLMGLTAPMVQGESITMTLTFEKAGDIVVEVPVDLERQDHGGMMQGSMKSDSGS